MHEETLESALALLRFHLVNNVLAFHDINLQRQHRPTLAEGRAFTFLLYTCMIAKRKSRLPFVRS